MPVRAVDDKPSDTLVVVSGEGFWTGSSTLPHLHHFFFVRLAVAAAAAPPAATSTVRRDARGTDLPMLTLACNVDSPEQVEAAFAAAVAAGATPVAEPVARDWGGRSAYFADPEGNRWEIAWAPSAEFDDRGALTSFG
jgi:catechol 2,3-dioxygenase-like lactoylglutathione lyase family enzyme